MMQQVDIEVKKRLQRTLRRGERIIQQLFRAPKHGRLYRKPGTKKVMYRASAPGEAAAIRFGAFRKSIRTSIERKGVALYEGRIGSIITDPPYPAILESEYGKRPTFQLALERLRKEIAEDWGQKK